MLQIRSDAPAAAAELSLSAAPHCGHVIVSDSQSDCQSYKSDSMEVSDIELDQQSDRLWISNLMIMDNGELDLW